MDTHCSVQHAIADFTKIAMHRLDLFVHGPGGADLGEYFLMVFLIYTHSFLCRQIYTTTTVKNVRVDLILCQGVWWPGSLVTLAACLAMGLLVAVILWQLLDWTHVCGWVSAGHKMACL